MEKKISLITCRPYAARLTARACGFRHRKALRASGRPRRDGRASQELRMVEFCLYCPEGKRNMALAVPCMARGCHRPPVRDRMCAEHLSKETASARREVERGVLL